MQEQSPCPEPAPFKYHLYKNNQNLAEKRFDRSVLTHLKTSKSINYETKENGQSNYQFLLQSQRVLKAQIRLSKLHLTLDTENNIENQLLLPIIQRFSGLSSLDLQFSGHCDNDTIPQGVLLKSLACLKHLNHLDLSFFFWMFDDAELLKRFMKTIKKLRKISSLSFIFFSCYYLTSLHYHVLFSSLSTITHLRSLKLDFDNSENLEDTDIEALSSALPRLALLTQLELVVEGDRIILESTLVRLFKAFKRLENLSNLALNLRGCRLMDFSDDGSILESLKYLVELPIERLSLGLFRNFTNQNLQELYETFPQFTHLKDFSLYVYNWYGLIDEWITKFGSVLAGLTSLASLCLYFPCQLTNKNIVQTLASAVKPLQNLISLKLDLQFSHEIKDEDFQALFGNLKYLNSLRYLDVQIPNQETITDTSLKILAESLQGLHLLRSLSLDLTQANLITNKGFEALCSAVGQDLTNLSSLSLKFERNKNINMKALSKLGEALQSLTVLDCVQLCFMKFWDANNFKEIFHILAKMKYLEKIQLSLPYTEENLKEVGNLEKSKNIISVSYFTKND